MVKNLQEQINAGIRLTELKDKIAHRQATAKLLASPGYTKEVINSLGEYGDTPLITAVKSGNRYMVSLLLMAGADVNVRNKGGQPAIRFAADPSYDPSYLAIVESALPLTRMLLEHGVDADGIKWALAAADKADVKKLLNTSSNDLLLKAESDASSIYVTTPPDYVLDRRLLNACKEYDAEKVKQLLNMGADPNRYHSLNKKGYTWYPLHYALEARADNAIIDQLLTCGAYPKHSGAPMTFPPIYLASRYSPAIVQALMNSGACVNDAVTGGLLAGSTALHAAFKYGSIDSILLLLKNGGSLFAKCGHGNATPLVAVIRRAKWNELNKILDLVTPQYPDIGFNELHKMVTPMMMLAKAVHNSSPEYVSVVEKCIKNPQIYLSRVDDEGCTALHHAVMSRNFVMVKALCRVRDANNAMPEFINMRNKEGFTALDIAAKGLHRDAETPLGRNYREIVMSLVSNGADMNDWVVYPASGDQKEAPLRVTPFIYLFNNMRSDFTQFEDPAKVLASLLNQPFDDEKIARTIREVVLGRNNTFLDYILRFAMSSLKKKNEKGEVYLFNLLTLAVDERYAYAVSRIIEFGKDFSGYADKHHALYRSVNSNQMEISDSLLSIGADPFHLSSDESGKEMERSACKRASSYDKEIIPAMICHYLVGIPYVKSDEDAFYVEHMEVVYKNLPELNRSDKAGREYLQKTLESILSYIDALVNRHESAMDKIDILNKVIGLKSTDPETLLSKFIRDSGATGVIAALHNKLTQLRGKTAAASIPSAPLSDVPPPPYEEQRIEPEPLIQKPEREPEPVASLPAYSPPHDAAPVPQPVLPPTEPPVYLKALQALEEKYEREIATLKQEYQAEAAALRDQIQRLPEAHVAALSEKDKTIAALERQVNLQKAVIKDLTVEVVKLRGPQVAAGELLKRSLIFSGSQQGDDSEAKQTSTPLGARSHIK